MKKRYFILIGAVIGWAATFALYAYGDRILEAAQADFQEAIQSNTKSITYTTPKSESKINILWTEKEPFPYEDEIQVRAGDRKAGKQRVVIFKKEK